MASSMGTEAASREGTDTNSFEEHQQVPVSHSDFKIFKSHESHLCQVLKNKFSCVSTLSCPPLEASSYPLGQLVFKKRLGPRLELSVWKDDLTKHAVDAVVNAANEELRHGGGLAGALVRAGGPAIQESSKNYIARFGKVPTGYIAVTPAGRLPCKTIIHAVGPHWLVLGRERSIWKLRDAISNVLHYVNTPHQDIKTIAIPALSSGLFQFPLDLCTTIIVGTIRSYFQNFPVVSELKEIHLVSNEDLTVASFQIASLTILGPSETGTWKNPTSYPGNRTLWIAQGLTLQIVPGHIQLQTTDVIVNSVNAFDLRSGPIAKSILQKAGGEMEREFNYLKPKLPSDNQLVLITKGYNLLCHYIFHVNWQSRMYVSETLKSAMQICLGNCLREDITSISFPALGTGGMGLSKSTAARIMFDEVSKFAEQGFKKSLTVKFVIFPEDMETYEIFCAEMARRSPRLDLSSDTAFQPSREEQRGDRLEAASPAINLMGSNLEDLSEAKAWIQRLLSSQDQHIIEDNHILYLGNKDHGFLAELQKTSRVSISEMITPGKAALKIEGAHADVIAVVMKIESLLADVQEEVAKKTEKRLWRLSEQWTGQKPKHQDKRKERITFLRYPAPPTQELRDRCKQFEKCGLQVIKVEQIENSVLKDAFQKKKRRMEGRQKGCRSQSLFQSVPRQFCNAVCRVGFHRVYSTCSDPKHGAGIEFTKNLQKLASKIKKPPSTDELIYVFEADVLMGSFCQGQGLNIVPPPLSPRAIDVHDSVVDSVSSPETIVIFNSIQARPRYLWTCRQDPSLSKDCLSAPKSFSSQQPWGKVSNGSSVD